MCIKTRFSTKLEDKCKNMNRNSLGRAISTVLVQARIENRLICGLHAAISYLGKTPDDTLICLLAETSPGDATSHMQSVLLQAFCYENYIPVIKVDSSEKLAELSGLEISSEKAKLQGQCVLVTRNLSIPWDKSHLDPPLTNGEQALADFYECTIEEYPTPIIQLPR